MIEEQAKPWTNPEPEASPAGPEVPPHRPTATDEAADVLNTAREHAGAVWADAKSAARAQLNEQKDAAADGLGSVAGVLRDAAQKTDGEHRNPLSGLTNSAADGLERLSGTLRSKDISAMVRDVETFAREQPLAFFGLAVAAGFLGVRFLKASNP